MQEWTAKGELPFPDMAAEQRESLSKTLEFPPKGSIEYKVMAEQEKLDSEDKS